jgi:hypothetical protein
MSVYGLYELDQQFSQFFRPIYHGIIPGWQLAILPAQLSAHFMLPTISRQDYYPDMEMENKTFPSKYSPI